MSNCSGNAAPLRAVDGGCVEAAAESDTSKSDLLTLGVVARMFKISPLTLRFYELAGLVRRRRAGASRTFSWTDCERIALIVKAHAAGLRIGDIKAVIRAMDQNAPRALAESALTECLALVHALEDRQRAVGNVLAELYRIEREIGEHLGGADKGAGAA